MDQEWIRIGKIVAPQGLQGEMRVKPESDFPERFEEPGERWLRPPNQTEPQGVQLQSGKPVPGKNLYIIRLAGITDRNQAEALRGGVLLVPASDRPPLEDGEFHVADLLNLPVYHQHTGELLGQVSDIYAAGQDLLEVRLTEAQQAKQTGKKTQKKALIPFVEAIVPVVDLAQGRIEVLPPPGLLGDGEGEAE